MPVIQMAYVGRGATGGDQTAFERRLFLMRKAVENQARKVPGINGDMFHIASLSSRTLIYKGMLLADQMTAFYPDLADPAHDQRPGPGASALQHQHISFMGPCPSLSILVPQWGN